MAGENKMSAQQALEVVRGKLKVGKDKFNEHGKFKYRDLETILREAKPLCATVGAALYFDEEIKVIGDRFYIMAVLHFAMLDAEDTLRAVGYAREADMQKGMNSAQLTGSTSSYAKKSACNNLFLLDDAQDADSFKVIPISEDQATEIEAKLNETGRDLKKFLEYFQVEFVSEISIEQYKTAMNILNAKPKVGK